LSSYCKLQRSIWLRWMALTAKTWSTLSKT